MRAFESMRMCFSLCFLNIGKFLMVLIVYMFGKRIKNDGLEKSLDNPGDKRNGK